MTDIMSNCPFSPVCHTNIDNTFFKLCQYTENLLQECVPLRTRHRQEMPPWITPSLSKLINKLKTPKKMLLEWPTANRKSFVSELENVLVECCEVDRLSYQENPFNSRNNKKTFKHLNHLNKTNCFLKIMYTDNETSRSENEITRFFNEFFPLVYSLQKHTLWKAFEMKYPFRQITTFRKSKFKVS